MRKIFSLFVYIFACIGFILVIVYAANQFGLTNTKGIVDNQHDFFKNQVGSSGSGGQTADVSAWASTNEWTILKQAIVKDTDTINAAATKTGVPARIIVAPLVVEQLRLFHDNREIFKEIFAPLKILGNQSQFSWGVMGIKQDTAREIENNLKDVSSPFYPGADYSHMLDYGATTTSPDAERFGRLTDEHDRYYSYLYSALFIKEIEAQWQKAGFPIDGKPGVIATLFNIGFKNSHPNAAPQIGGAEIDIGSTTYSFGGLSQSFYDSDELLAEFPRI